MPTREHRQILNKLDHLFTPPSTWHQYNHWITGEEQLRYIAEDVRRDEVILLANGPKFYIDTVIANRQLSQAFLSNQIQWDSITHQTIASFFEYDPLLIHTLDYYSHYTRRIISGRYASTSITMDADCGQLLGVRWDNRKSAYCATSDTGADRDIVISVTVRGSSREITLVTCKRKALLSLLTMFDSEMHTDSVLLRTFDFHLIDEDFAGCVSIVEDSSPHNKRIRTIDSLASIPHAYQQQYMRWCGGYIRGVQVLPREHA